MLFELISLKQCPLKETHVYKWQYTHIMNLFNGTDVNCSMNCHFLFVRYCKLDYLPSSNLPASKENDAATQIAAISGKNITINEHN